MGWTSGYKSAAEIRRELNTVRTSVKVVRQTSTYYGRHFWTLYETADGRRFIHLDLIEKAGNGWGYKGMSEEAHPFYYDCPSSLLAEAGETTSKDVLAWREKVRAFHERTTVTYNVGDRVMVYGKLYRVVGTIKRSYQIESLENSRIYKCSAAKMAPSPEPEMSTNAVQA